MNLNKDVNYLPVATTASSIPAAAAFVSSYRNQKSITSSSTSNDPPNSLRAEPSNVKWTKIDDTRTCHKIQPRHGHRAVAYKDLMIVFGGGNEGIFNELNIFNSTTREWFQPQVQGEIPHGRASYGLALDGKRMLMFGGMCEYSRYSNDLYELFIPNWEWKKLKPKGPKNCEPPCARLGHSFTIIKDRVYLFGGLANLSDHPKLNLNIPKYLNDLYILKLNDNEWELPPTLGKAPCPRESHSAIHYESKQSRFNKLIVYGGMNGCRLGDFHILNTDTLMWYKPEVKGTPPSPRSLHTATLVKNKMFIFAGWTPMMVEELKTSEKEWKCTNSLACLNVDTLEWETLHEDILDEKVPRGRAGHSAVVLPNNRIYIWSGRDGYRKAWNNQVCCKDLWQLEVQRPDDPGKVQLKRTGTTWLEIGWNPVPGADTYLLQCADYDVPLEPIFQQEPATLNKPSQSLAASGLPSSTTPIMTPVPTSSPVPQPMVTVSHDLSAQMPQPLHAGSVPVSVSVTVVSQRSMQIQPPVSQALGELPASSSIITLSMPSLAPTTAMSAMDASTIVTSASSGSPAVLPSASSLYTLPANLAGTASSLLASKSMPRQAMSQVTTLQPTAGRGVSRLRTPVQVPSTRISGIRLPTGATLLASDSTNVSAQMSGMNALAAAAVATQKMSNMSGVLPPGVRLTSPLTSEKPSEMKQIPVKNPGLPGAGNQIYTIVKTGQGVGLANFQGQKVIQGTVTTTNAVPSSSIQGSPRKGANIKWVVAPGSSIPTASKPSIIATNQPILGLVGQGSPENSPRPTYIISKPATTISEVQMTPSPVSQPMAGVPSLTSVSAHSSTPPIILSSSAPIMTTPSTAPVQQQTRPPGSQKPMDVKVNAPPPPAVPSPATNGTGLNQPKLHASFMPVAEEKQENWMDVIHTKETTHQVRCYFTTNEKLSELEADINLDTDLEFSKKKVELKPATVYKFRVAAINSCGRGPWGEVAAFKTFLPGFPGAPNSVKISKTSDGATIGITWEPPMNTYGDILEYSVYLAVKPSPNATDPNQTMPFARVYRGPRNQCNVRNEMLTLAFVNMISKPAIIFRIAAKNSKGYGPATQVRWLQDSAFPNFASTSTNSGLFKKPAPFLSSGLTTKRARTD